MPADQVPGGSWAGAWPGYREFAAEMRRHPGLDGSVDCPGTKSGQRARRPRRRKAFRPSSGVTRWAQPPPLGRNGNGITAFGGTFSLVVNP